VQLIAPRRDFVTAPVFRWGLAGKAYTDPAEYDVQRLVAPAVKIVPLPTDGSTFDPPKMIIGDKAGTATVSDAAGNADITSFPITGQEQRVAIRSLSSLSTTTKVWGLY
jgi:hypothetical protein